MALQVNFSFTILEIKSLLCVLSCACAKAHVKKKKKKHCYTNSKQVDDVTARQTRPLLTLCWRTKWSHLPCSAYMRQFCPVKELRKMTIEQPLRGNTKEADEIDDVDLTSETEPYKRVLLQQKLGIDSTYNLTTSKMNSFHLSSIFNGPKFKMLWLND